MMSRSQGTRETIDRDSSLIGPSVTAICPSETAGYTFCGSRKALMEDNVLGWKVISDFRARRFIEFNNIESVQDKSIYS